MIINKISDKNNTKIIAEKYVEWLNSGASTSEILVLSFNSNSKKNIIKNILNLSQNNVLTDIQIHTFKGLIYNTVLNNWAVTENLIKNNNTSIIPNLTGLEISQYLLKQIIKDEEVKGYNSKKSLLHQIFRRYSLIVNNNLSEKEIEEKSKILKESFGEDAHNILQRFKAKTIDLRAFDYIRQAQIFSYLYQKTDVFKSIKYLIIEDADELTPLCLDFIKNISQQLTDKLILIDKDGGSRCGYLCAEPNSFNIIKEIFNDDITDTQDLPQDIQTLVTNIVNDEKQPIYNLTLKSFSKRIDIVENTVESINDLIKSGVNPKDISVITPVQDKMLKYVLINGLKMCSPMFLSGNEKLVNNQLVKAVLAILKLSKKIPVDEYELRVVFSKYLGIPVKVCKKVFEEYRDKNALSYVDLGIYTEKYNSFCELLDKLQKSNLSLSEKAYHIYNSFIKKVEKEDLSKFNFLLKELQDFENVFNKDYDCNFENELILQIENSIISENPYSTLEIEDNDLIVSTPQMIIDNKIKTKYQFWLDISSQEWIMPDIGPLYNSWVFQKSWDKKEYTIEDNIRLTKEKTAKILRKLALNTEKIIALLSLFDSQGVENFGGIERALIPPEYTPTEDSQEKGFEITPRDDQKPVLEYERGRMAISAVPGAGKTTILLALILKLMERKINPEKIYVLTYMESAARNFKDRIKNINPDNNKLPNISTIHGLALRILKENSNYERIGLNSEFDICDDTKRGNIIKSLANNLSKEDIEDFDRATSVLKLSGADLNINNNQEIKRLFRLKQGSCTEMKLSRFLKFFYSYREKLKQENLIDYDDILILSVKLLEENPDILDYYQELCEYMIEDEAQDSSFIQQHLINLLSGKHKNLIRCGDINQAITTTFTNADVEGFKDFIKTSQRVDMNCSQRCTEGVWKLANTLVKYGNNNDFRPFFEIYMHPVEGKNPVEKDPIHPEIYKTANEEKIETVKIIKTLLEKNPNSTIGILLRNNYQVNKWADFINSSGLSAITRNECLAQKTIFRVIFSILKSISNPFNNYCLAEAYRALSAIGLFKPHLDKIIEDFDGDFISQDNDEIVDAELSRFHWDINYWLSYPELSIDELSLMIGLHYFSKSLEKSNIYLISTLCAKINTGIFSQTVLRLEELSNRPNLGGFKFFSEEEDKNTAMGKIQIMTMHKSKGDEFDYVFLPEMSEKNLTLNYSQLKLKKTSDFMEKVRGLNKDYTPQNDTKQKEAVINENYRLLYVAITRAKRQLYISTSSTITSFGKEKENPPSIIFDNLLDTVFV